MSATRSSQIFHRCQEPERLIEGDLTCGISPIGLAVSDNEVEIEYGSAVFSSGLSTGYDEAVYTSRRIGHTAPITCRELLQKLKRLRTF